MDALHFHRRMKNLSYPRRKIGAAGGTGEHPSLHVAFDEGAFVLRREQSQNQNFLALGTGRTFGESDSVANIYRHGASLSKIIYMHLEDQSASRVQTSAGKIL
jgi:hypothetical protein